MTNSSLYNKQGFWVFVQCIPLCWWKLPNAPPWHSSVTHPEEVSADLRDQRMSGSSSVTSARILLRELGPDPRTRPCRAGSSGRANFLLPKPSPALPSSHPASVILRTGCGRCLEIRSQAGYYQPSWCCWGCFLPSSF